MKLLEEFVLLVFIVIQVHPFHYYVQQDITMIWNSKKVVCCALKAFIVPLALLIFLLMFALGDFTVLLEPITLDNFHVRYLHMVLKLD